MKKIITFCFFAFLMVLGTQTATAQTQAKFNENASLKAKELRAMLKFDDNALEQVYLAYQEFESKSYTLETRNTPGTDKYNKNKATIQSNLLKRIKAVLSDAMYQRYLIATDQQDSITPEAKATNSQLATPKSAR